MFKSVKEHINILEGELYDALRVVEKVKIKIADVYLLRSRCQHEFSSPLKNFEHEGGYCKECGINELHAHALKQGV